MSRIQLRDVSDNGPGPAKFSLVVGLVPSAIDSEKKVVQFVNEWPGDEAGSICLDLHGVQQLIEYLQHAIDDLAVQDKG